MRNYRFHLYQDHQNEWRWQLCASNGRIIADCGEGYSSKRNAENGVQALLRIAKGGTYKIVGG